MNSLPSKKVKWWSISGWGLARVETPEGNNLVGWRHWKTCLVALLWGVVLTRGGEAGSRIRRSVLTFFRQVEGFRKVLRKRHTGMYSSFKTTLREVDRGVVTLKGERPTTNNSIWKILGRLNRKFLEVNGRTVCERRSQGFPQMSNLFKRVSSKERFRFQQGAEVSVELWYVKFEKTVKHLRNVKETIRLMAPSLRTDVGWPLSVSLEYSCWALHSYSSFII